LILFLKGQYLASHIGYHFLFELINIFICGFYSMTEK